MRKKLRVGLTGGIGSGKSTVANLFKNLDVGIIDADIIAREVVKPGTPALQKIKEHFGAEIVNNQGELRRDILRQKIFNHPTEKDWLEKLLHPLIWEEIEKQADQCTSPYCLLVIPLLFEANLHVHLDRILVVDTPESTQIERTMARDGFPLEAVKKIIAAQVSREVRLSKADDIISNDQNITQLEKQVLDLHNKYLKLSQ